MRNKILYLFASLVMLSGCNNQPAYKDSSLSPEERAEDLLQQLTLEEKVALMMDNSKPVERLGIKPYNWWNEALHGVARSGLATVFPQPIGMAASFEPDAIHTIYTAVSDEARAKNAAYSAAGSYERYQGLTMWTPTVNIYRDPRWGRGIETYGEDPYLTSVMGVNVVKDCNAWMLIKNTIKYTLVPNTLPSIQGRNGIVMSSMRKISNRVTCMKLILYLSKH